MSDLASIARDYFDAWNRRDWARYKELMHNDYSYTGGDGFAGSTGNWVPMSQAFGGRADMPFQVLVLAPVIP